jgi:hypothetical protein
MYNNQIYQLRQVELDPKVAAKLWPFINAWRNHDDVYSWRELKEQGLEPLEEESLMDIIVDQYEYDKETGV